MKKRNKKISNTMAVFALLATMCFIGCASNNHVSNDADSIKDTFENTDSQSDSKKSDSEETKQKLTFEEIELLAQNNIFNVTWYAEDDSFTSGTAFLMDSDTHHEKLLVTAFHFLMPEDNFSGSDLPEYLQGGQIFYASSFEATGASIKNCIVIDDAAPVPKAEKDVAAFTIQGGDALQTLPLSTHDVKKGDTVYLLADLWDTEDIHENCVYEAKVLRVDKDCVYYELDSKYGTTGASGAPVVNEYGEVIGIHLASSGSTRMAHSSESFKTQIDSGKISAVSYPEKAEDSDSENEGELFDFERQEKVSTLFYDLQIDRVRVTDSINGVAAQTGEKFLIFDMCIRGHEGFDEPIKMYSQDFAIMLMEEEYEDYDLIFPVEEILDEAQLEEEYTIDTNADTKGTLIFSIPEEVEDVILEFEDYYWIGDSEEINYGDVYVILLPVEDWNRYT